MTDREQLAARHTAAIRRHWRSLTDSGGQPPQQLLDELAAIAEYHAGTRTAEALKALAAEQPPADQQPTAKDKPGTTTAAPAGKTPRRTPARRTAK